MAWPASNTTFIEKNHTLPGRDDPDAGEKGTRPGMRAPGARGAGQSRRRPGLSVAWLESFVELPSLLTQTV